MTSLENSYVAAMWHLARLIRDGHSITTVCQEVAKTADAEWDVLRSDLLDALEALTAECGTPLPAGVQDRGGYIEGWDWEASERPNYGDLYWWYNNAETEWTSDRPEWWPEDVAG